MAEQAEQFQHTDEQAMAVALLRAWPQGNTGGGWPTIFAELGVVHFTKYTTGKTTFTKWHLGDGRAISLTFEEMNSFSKLNNRLYNELGKAVEFVKAHGPLVPRALNIIAEYCALNPPVVEDVAENTDSGVERVTGLLEEYLSVHGRQDNVWNDESADEKESVLSFNETIDAHIRKKRALKIKGRYYMHVESFLAEEATPDFTRTEIRNALKELGVKTGRTIRSRYIVLPLDFGASE